MVIWQTLCRISDWCCHSKIARVAALEAVAMPVAIERYVWLAGAAAISGEASDSQGEVGSKQLGASAANQTRGDFPCLATPGSDPCLLTTEDLRARDGLLSRVMRIISSHLMAPRGDQWGILRRERPKHSW